MRLPEPVAQHAIFRNTVQHAVRSDDRRVHRAGKNQRANNHHENMKRQARHEWPGQTHRQPANQILEELRPRLIRYDHHREE